MGRILSAAALKRKKGSKVLQEKPRQGSNIRKLYDLFMSNKGKPVPSEQLNLIFPNRTCGILGACIQQLTDFYGLDIRGFASGPKKKGCRFTYYLMGEVVDGKYVDYFNTKAD